MSHLNSLLQGYISFALIKHMLFHSLALFSLVIESTTMYHIIRSFKQCGKPVKMQRAFMQEGTEGATSRSKGWSDKERATETVWAKQAVCVFAFIYW